ncbi:MAG: CHAT domain-containing protein [Synergistaceae bacterium]|nr:CHAT domain-containing protein [Synergistota bacterium]NLM71498.1 CHAT domain-containing protein [Synergistaceae bacterium]
MRTKFFAAVAFVFLLAIALLLPVEACAASKGEEEMQRGLQKYAAKEYASAAGHFSKASAMLEKEKKVIPAADAAYNEGLCRKAAPLKEGETPSGRAAGAIAAFDRSAALYSRGKDETKAANALIQGAQLAFAESNLTGAEKRYDNARAKGADLKSDLLEGLALEGLGKVALHRGRPAESRHLYLEALDKLDGVPSARARVSLQLAAAVRKYGDMQAALACLDAEEERLAPLEEGEKTKDLAGLIRFLILAERGHTYTQMGIYDQARDYLKEAYDYEPENPLIDEANRLYVRGNGLVAEGELDNPAFSAEELKVIMKLAASKGLKDVECGSLISIGRLLRTDGKYPEAEKCFDDAAKLAREADLPVRNVQALLSRANLLYFQGAWKSSENYYRMSFNSALEQGDMENVLVALMGVERIARSNHTGLSGKVDFRKIQGIPWRGALLQDGGIGPERGGSALPAAWERLGEISREWFSYSVPGIRGSMTVLSLAGTLSWPRMEAMARHLVAEGILRLVTGRREVFRKAAEALRSIDKGREGASDPQSTRQAYTACWNALSNAAGKGLLGKRGVPPPVRIDGLLLVPDDPADQDPSPSDDPDGIKEAGRLLDVLVKAVNTLSLKEKEQHELMLALLKGERIPPHLAERLVMASGSRAAERSRVMEGRLRSGGADREAALKEYTAEIQPLLERLGGSPLDEIRGRSKLDEYLKTVERKSRRHAEERASLLARSIPPFMVYSLSEAVALSGVESAWAGLTLRMALLRRLEAMGEPREMNLRQGMELIAKSLAKGAEVFDGRFSLADKESAAEREKKIEEMLAIAEELVRIELQAQYSGCMEIVDAYRGIGGLDDEQAMKELVARHLLALGEPSRAHDMAEDVRQGFRYAARTAAGAVNPEVVWRTLSTSAKASLALGRKDEALSFVDQAIEVMESVIPADGVNSQATADRLDVYRTGIETAYELYEADRSQKNAERLWEYLEGMKSRQWREMLAATGGAFLDRLPEKEVELYRSLNRQATQLLASILFLDLRGQAREADEAKGELQQVRRKVSELVAGHTVDASERVPSLKETTSAIHGDWAVADYYISPNLSFAFVLQKGKRAEVLRLPLDYDSFFAYTFWMRGDEGGEFNSARANERVMAAGMTSPRLAEQLFNPIAELIGDKRKLLVIPHDILYTFPYETLSVKRGEGFRFLLDEGWTFAELPSAFLLTKGARAGGADGERLVVFADPDYYPRLKDRHGAEKALEKVLEGVESPHLQRIREAFCKFMKPLGNARREGESIAALWDGHGESTLLTGADASERMLYDPNIAAWDARHVHLVCHGYDRHSIPDLQPGLALSPADDKENDSFAQMGELSALRWRSELVVLSACDTGLGDLFIGDGMVGLNTVFLAGGVKGIVISRWKVSDESAPEFMRIAYERMAAGAAPVDALSEAKVELKGIYDQPFDWAVFKYVGVPW